jgi:MFS family permease
VIVYFVSYATRELQFSLRTTLLVLITAAALFAFLIPIFATASDRSGRRRLMQWGLGLLVPASFLFFPLIDTKSIPLTLLALCGILLLQGAYVGPQAAAFSELFPTAVRYSGASLSVTLEPSSAARSRHSSRPRCLASAGIPGPSRYT